MLSFYIDLSKRCYVSIICFPPDKMVELLTEMTDAYSNLQVFLNTVVKKVDVSDDSTTIEALYAISRQVFIFLAY